MPSSESMFDNIVKHYVASRLNNKECTLSDSEKTNIEKAVRFEVLKDAYKIIGRNLLDKAKEEADEEKKKIVRKFTITLIIEAMFIAFLVGIIINQVTSFIPAKWIAGIITIVVSLLLCVMILFLNAGIEKD